MTSKERNDIRMKTLGGECKYVGCTQHRYYESKVHKLCYYHHHKKLGHYDKHVRPAATYEYEHDTFWEVQSGSTWGS